MVWLSLIIPLILHILKHGFSYLHAVLSCRNVFVFPPNQRGDTTGVGVISLSLSHLSVPSPLPPIFLEVEEFYKTRLPHSLPPASFSLCLSGICDPLGLFLYTILNIRPFPPLFSSYSVIIKTLITTLIPMHHLKSNNFFSPFSSYYLLACLFQFLF